MKDWQRVRVFRTTWIFFGHKSTWVIVNIYIVRLLLLRCQIPRSQWPLQLAKILSAKVPGTHAAHLDQDALFYALVQGLVGFDDLARFGAVTIDPIILDAKLKLVQNQSWQSPVWILTTNSGSNCSTDFNRLSLTQTSCKCCLQWLRLKFSSFQRNLRLMKGLLRFLSAFTPLVKVLQNQLNKALFSGNWLANHFRHPQKTKPTRSPSFYMELEEGNAWQIQVEERRLQTNISEICKVHSGYSEDGWCGACMLVASFCGDWWFCFCRFCVGSPCSPGSRDDSCSSAACTSAGCCCAQVILVYGIQKALAGGKSCVTFEDHGIPILVVFCISWLLRSGQRRRAVEAWKLFGWFWDDDFARKKRFDHETFRKHDGFCWCCTWLFFRFG